jgi:hypothetical protein
MMGDNGFVKDVLEHGPNLGFIIAKSRKTSTKSSRVGTPTETAVFTGSERHRTDRSPFNLESIGMLDTN